MMAIIIMDGAAKEDMRAILIRNKTGNVKVEDGLGEDKNLTSYSWLWGRKPSGVRESGSVTPAKNVPKLPG